MWIFWGLVGVVLLGWIATRYTTISNVLTILIGIGGSLGALIAAGATLKTVREMQAGRQEDRANRRPRFVFIHGEIGVTTQEEGSDFITIVCKQVGINPAATVTATASVVMFHGYGDIVTKVESIRPANPISQNAEFTFSMMGALVGGHI